MASERSPYAPPEAAVHTPGAARDAYFTVGSLKLVLMSLTTLGLYELYWFYRNWKVIRNQDQSDIMPFWRAFFAPFWTFSMGYEFVEQAKTQGTAITLPVAPLGILYLIWNILWRLPDPYWLVSLLSPFLLLPFEHAARRIDGRGTLARPTYGRFSVWNIAWIVVGSLFLVLVLIGTFLPDDAA
jgi:hypothetical protein